MAFINLRGKYLNILLLAVGFVLIITAAVNDDWWTHDIMLPRHIKFHVGLIKECANTICRTRPDIFKFKKLKHSYVDISIDVDVTLLGLCVSGFFCLIALIMNIVIVCIKCKKRYVYIHQMLLTCIAFVSLLFSVVWSSVRFNLKGINKGVSFTMLYIALTFILMSSVLLVVALWKKSRKGFRHTALVDEVEEAAFDNIA